jgi:hypothetical protein
MTMNWLKRYPSNEPRYDLLFMLTCVTCACLIFLTVAWVYDMGVRTGMVKALATAYEVCKKVGCR